MHYSSRTTELLDQVAETTVVAAWLAVPLFALLAAGRLAPPLHAASVTTLLTLALRCWRAAQRGKTLHQTRERLASYLSAPARPVLVPRRHYRHAPHRGDVAAAGHSCEPVRAGPP